jgi:PhoPQ-activated pathogenicity-related protein
MKRTLLCLGLALAAFVAAPCAETVLDRYVARPDPAFQWELARTIPGEGVSGYVLDVTSQNWLTPAEVDRTAWKHWVTVYKPARVMSDIALLMIGGGSNLSKPPEKLDPFLRLVAEKTGTVAV